MKIIDKIVDFLLLLLPIMRKKNAGELKEFSELITSQYRFLVEQLEKALTDYFTLSDRVKALHSEVVALREQLAETLPHSCADRECEYRKTVPVSMDDLRK